MRELSLHILDLAQNSLTAGASRLDIIVEIDHKKDLVAITLSDDGKGMAPDFLKTVTSPFTTTRTTRKVGLGIPMFKENAELTGGTFSIESTVGVGTKMRAGFVLSSIDRPPLGDLAATMISLVVSNPEFHFISTIWSTDSPFPSIPRRSEPSWVLSRWTARRSSPG